MCLAAPMASSQACHLKLKERNITNKHNRLKNPNWRGAHQLAIYKYDRQVEPGSLEKQLLLSGQSRT